MSKQVLIYSMEECPHCTDLKEMVKAEGINFKTIDVDEYEDEWERVKELTKTEFVPTIMVKDTQTRKGKYICPDVHFQDLEEALYLLKKELNYGTENE